MVGAALAAVLLPAGAALAFGAALPFAAALTAGVAVAPTPTAGAFVALGGVQVGPGMDVTGGLQAAVPMRASAARSDRRARGVGIARRVRGLCVRRSRTSR